TTLAKNIAKLLGSIEVNDCPYNCLASAPKCPICREKIKKKEKIKTKTISGLDRFIRVQGSPDLTVEDLFGDIDPIKAMKFGPMSIEAFTPGKIFKANNGVLFFDEINRCNEKLQNALLQVLEEKKITLGSYTIDFEVNFILIATMNPYDYSTEMLSDVFIDRFDIIKMGYPENKEIEKEIVIKKAKHLQGVEFPDQLLDRVITFIRDLRNDENLEKKPSVRASIGIYERACANAIIEHRKVVTTEDIEDAIISVLYPKIRLKPSVRYVMKKEDYIRKKYESSSLGFDLSESKESSEQTQEEKRGDYL
ncbi:MAG: MoxR family ATPase, partial [Epsilonproteobacteria bacterium]